MHKDKTKNNFISIVYIVLINFHLQFPINYLPDTNSSLLHIICLRDMTWTWSCAAGYSKWNEILGRMMLKIAGDEREFYFIYKQTRS